MAVDIFTKTNPCSFRGIPFPVSKFSQSESHANVPHRAVDRDGARIEMVGLEPRQFTLTIPLINNLQPGPNEEWVQPLFPDTYDELLIALRDRSTGVLVHPTEGELNVKAVSFPHEFDSSTRNGVVFEVTFLETIEGEELLDPSQANFSVAMQAMEELEGMPIVEELDFDFSSFKDSLRQLQSVFDGIGIMEAQLTGLVTGLIQDLDSLAASISRLSNESMATVDNIVTQGIALDLIAQAKGTCEEAKQAISIKHRLKVLTTSEEMTWNQLERETRTSVTKLMDLNASLVRGPTVPANSQIVYLG